MDLDFFLVETPTLIDGVYFFSSSSFLRRWIWIIIIKSTGLGLWFWFGDIRVDSCKSICWFSKCKGLKKKMVTV